MATTSKTAKAAAALVEATAVVKPVSVEIKTDAHRELVDNYLLVRVGAAQAGAVLGGAESQIKAEGRALYDKHEGAGTSITMEGTNASLKVVVKSQFSPIHIENLDPIEGYLRLQAIAEGREGKDVEDRVRYLFDLMFTVESTVSFVMPSPEQLVYVHEALKLAAEVKGGNEEIDPKTGRAFRKLERGGAEVKFDEIFVTTRYIAVKPEVAEMQYHLHPEIKALLKQTAPSIVVAPKEIAKIDVNAAVTHTCQKVEEYLAEKASSTVKK